MVAMEETHFTVMQLGVAVEKETQLQEQVVVEVVVSSLVLEALAVNLQLMEHQDMEVLQVENLTLILKLTLEEQALELQVPQQKLQQDLPTEMLSLFQ